MLHHDLTKLELDKNSAYPSSLKNCEGFKRPPTLYMIGNPDLLSLKLFALFCSNQCPGDLILKTYDLAQALREASVPVIGSFHTPIEKDILRILLRGSQPIIHCYARSLHNIRLSKEQKQAITEHRLLLLSPFNANYSRVSSVLAEKRNAIVGAIAQTIFIAYAAPKSKTLEFACNLVNRGKRVITFNLSINSSLHQYGIPGLDIPALLQRL